MGGRAMLPPVDATPEELARRLFKSKRPPRKEEKDDGDPEKPAPENSD